jgi:hypothetical protein
MLKISAESMNAMTRNMFFARVRGFISENCRNDKLLARLAEPNALSAFWFPHWAPASKLSEHDTALLLVLLAVCECEGVDVVDAATLADQIGEREVQIKKFIADRGYFRFSDFDYPSGRDDGDEHG